MPWPLASQPMSSAVVRHCCLYTPTQPARTLLQQAARAPGERSPRYATRTAMLASDWQLLCCSAHTWYVREVVPSRPLAARPLASTMHKSTGAGPGSRICCDRQQQGREQRGSWQVQAMAWHVRRAGEGSCSCSGGKRSPCLSISPACAAHLVHGLQHVQREAQQRGRVVLIRFRHPCADHESVRPAVQLVDLQGWDGRAKGSEGSEGCERGWACGRQGGGADGAAARQR